MQEVCVERIRQLRNDKGLSQAKLAVAAGMDPATLNRLEQGKGNPNLRTLERVADALGVEVADLLGKAQRRSSPEPSLFNGLEGERREAIYKPWAEFVNRFAERWERKIVEGTFDHGAVLEFIGILEDVSPVLSRLGLEEKREQPGEYPYSFGPVMGAAISRLMGLANPLIEAGTKQVEESDLARLRRQREELAAGQNRAASG